MFSQNSPCCLPHVIYSPQKYSIPLYLTSKHALLFTFCVHALSFQWDCKPSQDRDRKSFLAVPSSTQHSTLHTVNIWYLSSHDRSKLLNTRDHYYKFYLKSDFPKKKKNFLRFFFNILVKAFNCYNYVNTAHYHDSGISIHALKFPYKVLLGQLTFFGWQPRGIYILAYPKLQLTVF